MSSDRTAKKNEMGLPDNPDKDPKKSERFRYGCYMVQPPGEYHKKNPKERLVIYKSMVNFFNLLKDAIDVIRAKGVQEVFKPTTIEDQSLSVWRLVYDPDNEYAELYQQEEGKNGEWNRGDFIWNLGAKNDNLHTLVHAIGHQYFYECISDEDAEDWKDYYELRKHRNKHEFVSEYAKQNHREDFAETFACYILGRDKINGMYDKMKITKDIGAYQKILGKFKKLVSDKKKK